MKLSQAKECLHLVQAAAEGKTIQVSCENGARWKDLPLDFDIGDVVYPQYYRIKPLPTLRPWKPEEVPVGALLRSLTKSYEWVTIILGYNATEFCHPTFNDVPECSTFAEGLAKYEHSLDHGLTWKPCGVVTP